MSIPCTPSAQSTKSYWTSAILAGADRYPTPTLLAERFALNARRWRKDTLFVASVAKRSMHPAYQNIIAMGLDVVPLILEDLATNGPDDWFWALSKITGENPITESIAGDMNKMTEAWLLWAKKAGYPVTCHQVRNPDSQTSTQTTIE